MGPKTETEMVSSSAHSSSSSSLEIGFSRPPLTDTLRHAHRLYWRQLNSLARNSLTKQLLAATSRRHRRRLPEKASPGCLFAYTAKGSGGHYYFCLRRAARRWRHCRAPACARAGRDAGAGGALSALAARCSRRDDFFACVYLCVNLINDSLVLARELSKL